MNLYYSRYFLQLQLSIMHSSVLFIFHYFQITYQQWRCTSVGFHGMHWWVSIDVLIKCTLTIGYKITLLMLHNNVLKCCWKYFLIHIVKSNNSARRGVIML